MSRMNNSKSNSMGDGPPTQPGYPQNMMGHPGFPQGMPMGPSPQAPTAQQQQQHHERLMQLKMQQQQLEMQLKQNKLSNNQQMHAAQMMQQQQLQRRRSSGSTSLSTAVPTTAGRNSPGTLMRPPDLKKPPPPTMLSPSLHRQTIAPPTITGAGANIALLPTALRRDQSSQLAPPVVPTEQMKQLMTTLNWTDRSIYISRLMLGGASVNGFLRATATAQRIKKQRARQIKKQQTTPNEEENLKKEAMNPRTAKKLRAELCSGLEFCKSLHDTLRSVVRELDPSQMVAPLAEPNPVATGMQSASYVPPKPMHTMIPPAPTTAPSPKRIAAPPQPQAQPSPQKTSTTTASPGDRNGSTLRKLRKRKFPDLPTPNVDEVDPETGRKYSRKDYALLLLEVSRFRALNEGDYVAAKVSSRDLWILARVVKDYPLDCGPSPAEFLQLSESKRDALFRDKVIIKDVEDSNSTSTIAVVRSNVLPLPRTFAEAADWGSRCRKASRVYAMYPMTTSLYSGTVIDNTTYCRGDDDIIVVEFDGDEADAKTNKMPQYHIPARFVTMIPREPTQIVTQSHKKRKSAAAPAAAAVLPNSKAAKRSATSSGKHKRGASSDSALNNMLDEIAYGDIGGIGGDLDLDQFDLGFDVKGK